MTSQIEKGLDEEALLIAQKAAEDAYMAEVYEGLAFDGAITAGIRAYLTATGESKTESSPDVTEAPTPGVKALTARIAELTGFLLDIRKRSFEMSEATGLRAEVLRQGLADINTLAYASGASCLDAALSVGREGAAQGWDAVRVKKADAVKHAVELEQCAIFAADAGPAIAKAMTDAAAWLRAAALDTSPEGMVEERI